MLVPYEIPLDPNSQRLSIDLAGVTYNLTVIWNRVSNCWVLDIADQYNAPMLQGVPIVTGCNLLEPYRYMGFNGGIMAITDSDPDAVPTYANLGSTGRVYFVAVVSG